jgi:hypothetical protein
MDDQLRELLNELNKHKKEQDELSSKVLEILKGADRVSVMPEVLCSIFESLEHEGDMNFQNLIMYWGLERYVSKKVTAQIENIGKLYDHCVKENYTQDNTWHWGSGDRTVCFIPSETKKILLFENQNIQFVCVVDLGRLGDLHIRKVYPDLFNEYSGYGFYSLGSFGDVDHLREGLKGENGLEIAVANLTGKYKEWSNSISGVKYPCRISLKSMIEDDFSAPNRAFDYGDNRDEGYILSVKFMDRCEVSDYYQAAYVFYDVIGAIKEMEENNHE